MLFIVTVLYKINPYESILSVDSHSLSLAFPHSGGGGWNGVAIVDVEAHVACDM